MKTGIWHYDVFLLCQETDLKVLWDERLPGKKDMMTGLE